MRAFLATDYKKIIAQLEKNRDEELKNPNLSQEQRQETRLQFNEQISKNEKALKIREDLVARNAELKEALFAVHEWNKRDDRYATLAFDIGEKSRKVYDLLYKTKSEENACRNFKL